jgi:polysaccharide deacetylase 2 family uncharacterized protein YibQ
LTRPDKTVIIAAMKNCCLLSIMLVCLLTSCTAAATEEKQGDAAPLMLSPLPPAIGKPAWIANAISFAPEADKPMIALVIDDMGVDRKRSAQALKLPAPVTMSYLPYGRKIKEQVAAAQKAGHEILVHVPMEPERRTADPGPDYLGVKFTAEEIHKRLVRNLSAFDGYVGINNHMGSKFTCCNRAGLEVVMKELKKRDLLFLDSKTVAHSLAEKVAAEYNLPASHRDVFLDDEETDSFTEEALTEVERTARKRGAAIAIGHPRDITLKAIMAWIPKAEARGFQFVPLSAAVRYRMNEAEDRALASLKEKASAPVPEVTP